MQKSGLIVIWLLILPITSIAGELFLAAGICYDPVAKLDYTQRSDPKIEFYDNLHFEFGAKYLTAAGFSAGLYLAHFSKGINPGGNTHSDLSMWNIGFLGDYQYALTESGRALIVIGAESDYGYLADDGGYGVAYATGFGVGGILGWRYRFIDKTYFELDYRFAYQKFNIEIDPKRAYEFSDSTIRLTIAYSLINLNN